jgi:iron(III) transport system ATP-binding protein
MFLALQNRDRALRPAAAVVQAVDVSLGLAAGQIGVLIGPSGCGKTSLLRAGGRAGALQCRVASSMDGDALSDAALGLHLAPEARRIGMVFQDYALFPHLSVQPPMWPSASATRAEASARRERVERMLDLVGLGMRRGARRTSSRVASSSAWRWRARWHRSPPAAARRALLQPGRRPARAAGAGTARHPEGEGTTALFVTHDQLEAFAIGDVIGVMNKGHLEQWDDAYNLYHRPASALRGRVHRPRRVHAGAHRARRATTGAHPLGPLDRRAPSARCPSAFPEGQCDVLLRADDIVHDDEPGAACIERKAFRGSEFLLHAAPGHGEQVMATCPRTTTTTSASGSASAPQVDHVVTFPR